MHAREHEDERRGHGGGDAGKPAAAPLAAAEVSFQRLEAQVVAVLAVDQAVNLAFDALLVRMRVAVSSPDMA